MKFAILGATGPTGVLLVKECLDKNHEVTALVRNPEKLQIKNDRLSVQKVDIFEQNDLVPHMRGCDAVMSCLGTYTVFKASTIYTASIKVITAAMKEAGVTRFVAISSWGTKPDPSLPWVMRWIIRPIFLRQVLPDMAGMEDHLASCPDLDYTVARPAQLTNDASKGNDVIAVDGQHVPDVDMKISRHDVAKFMLKCVVDGEWKKTHVAIGVK